MSAADHDMRPECAEAFATLRTEVLGAKEDKVDARQDFRELRALLLQTREDMLTEVATLKERARAWGVVGGLIGSAVLSIVGAIILAAVL